MRWIIDEDVLCMTACCALIAACGVLSELMLGDRSGALRDLLFAGVTLAGFLLALVIYAASNYGRTDYAGEYAYSAQEAGTGEKEAFSAQVLVMARPQPEHRDIFGGMSPPFFETERVIASGRYRLELVRSHVANGEPTLIVSEE